MNNEQNYTHDQVQVIAKQVGADPNKLWEALNGVKKEVQEVEVDPGEGFRLLLKDEPICKGDEYWQTPQNRWYPSICGGSTPEAENNFYRRPIRLQDKAHRWVDVGEPRERTDQYYLPNQVVWVPYGGDAIPVTANQGPEFFRRALERGISKSPLTPEQLKAIEEAGELAEQASADWRERTRIKSSDPIPCNPPSTEPSNMQKMHIAPQENADLHNAPPSTVAPQEESSLVKGVTREWLESHRAADEGHNVSAGYAPQEGEEEVFPPGTMKPFSLIGGDKIGSITCKERECSLESWGWGLTFGEGVYRWFNDREMESIMATEPVRRRKSKPEPPKTPFWEGECEVEGSYKLGDKWSINLTANDVPAALSKCGQRVKVTVEVI